MIIETSDNRFFTVRPAATMDHVWFGTEVKRDKNSPDGWIYKKGARETLVRKAATRIIQN